MGGVGSKRRVCSVLSSKVGRDGYTQQRIGRLGARSNEPGRSERIAAHKQSRSGKGHKFLGHHLVGERDGRLWYVVVCGVSDVLIWVSQRTAPKIACEK